MASSWFFMIRRHTRNNRWFLSLGIAHKNRACVLYATFNSFLVHFYGYYKHAIQQKSRSLNSWTCIYKKNECTCVCVKCWNSNIKNQERKLSGPRSINRSYKQTNKEFNFIESLPFLDGKESRMSIAYIPCTWVLSEFLLVTEMRKNRSIFFFWFRSIDRAARRFNWSKTLGPKQISMTTTTATTFVNWSMPPNKVRKNDWQTKRKRARKNRNKWQRDKAKKNSNKNPFSIQCARRSWISVQMNVNVFQAKNEAKYMLWNSNNATISILVLIEHCVVLFQIRIPATNTNTHSHSHT